MIFYLLNKGQQTVKLLNNNETVESSLDESINEASELKFSVPLQKRLDSNIYYVLIPTDNENDFYMFKIISEDIQKDRVEYSAVESAYDELKSYSYIKDIRPNQMNAAQMLQQVLKNTRWSLGYVEDTGIQSSTFYYITVLEAIQKIVDLFKVELTFTIQLDPVTQQITGRKVNLYQQQGRRTGKRFEYGSNLLTVTREENSQNLVTALVGRGKGIQVSGQNTEDTTDDGYGRRLTFADVEWKTSAGAPVNKPKGQEYVEDPKATALYGFSDGHPRIGLVTFDDIEDPNQLINATWSALLEAKRPKVSFKAEVTDVGKLQLGDTIAIIRHDLGIEYFTRVYKVHHNLKDENRNTVEMGDDFSSRSITSAISTAIQTSQDATTVANTAAIAANGKNRNFYSNTKPNWANEGDNLYLNLGNGETELWVWHHGQWEFVQSTVELHTVQKEVQEAQSGLNDAKKQISDNLAKADGDIAELNASIRDQKKAFDTDIDELNASIRDQKKAFDTDIDGLSTTVNTVVIPKVTDVTNKVSDTITKVNEQKNIVTELQNQATQQGKDISKITADVHGVTVDLANLNGDVNQTKATVQGLQSTLGNAQGDIAQIKVDAKRLETSLSGKVDNSTYATFVNQTNQALNAKLVASDLNGYAKTTELQATASGLQLNIDSVNGRLDNLKIGTRNLLHGTSDQYRTLTNNDENGRLQKTTASSSITSVGHYLTGAQFTYAATLINPNNQPVQLEACLCDNSGNPLPDSFYSSSVSNAGNWPVSVTFSITQKTWFIRTWLVFPNNDGTQGEQVYVKDERLVEGTTPNTWSPNPDDTEQSLTQLSARITANSQRFSSYYTKSETDAKADTAKSDAVNTIKGDANWTGLTNIITNSGFLQSADGFVQKVQQTTLPMLNGGGVNLVKGTSNDWQTLTGSGRFQQTTSNYWYSTSYEKTGDQITYSIRIKNTSSYPVCAEIVGYDWNQSTRVTAAQSPVVQPGAEQSVSVTLTISSSTWWVGGWVVTQDSSTPQLSIQVKSEKLERGSVATPWTPNSAELVTQVAFTELTQTVNGLQSTVSGNYGDLQTRISQTDSAIREELSNQITGVTNQITTTASGLNARIDNIRVGGRNLLHGTSDQYRTLTYKQQYYATTASDMWTSTEYYLDGDQFTYSATITNTSEVPVRLALYCYDNDKKTMLKKAVGPTVGPNLRSVPTSVSITIDNSTWFICSDIETLDGQASSFSIKVKDEQLEKGTVPTQWTANPDDVASQFTEVNATINGLQSTVSGNYGALQTQISQTDSAIREELSDQISGVTNQITTTASGLTARIDNIRVGGRNLLHGTSDQYRTLTYKQQYYATTASDMWTSTKYYLDGDQFTYSATIANTSEVPVRLALYCYGTNKQGQLQKVVGSTVESGKTAVTSVSITIDNQTWFLCSDIETLDGEASTFSIQVKDEQLEEGNVRTSWTTNPDDIASQFTEVNATINGLQSTVGSNYGSLQSQISQTAKNIRQEVSDKTNGLQTQITQQSNNFNVSLNKIQQTDGVNILRGTRDFSGDWDQLNNWYKDGWVDPNGNYAIKRKGAWGGASQQRWLDVGTYTFSVYYYFEDSDSSTRAWVFPVPKNDETLKITENSSSSLETTKDKWIKKVYTFTVTTPGTSAVRVETNSNTATIHVGSYKLEKGYKETPWTTSPYDIYMNPNVVTKVLTSVQDLNNLTLEGNYVIKATNNTNSPIGNWLVVRVEGSGDRLHQTISADNDPNLSYTRTFNGSWSAWQRTVTGGNIMAQINVAAGTTLIQNDKIYMDASSTVFSGKAFIPDAAITNISADKINTGTLDAGRINVINLNANNITTGTINGANLKINLNSGEILFQKGRIASTNGNLNIDIDSGTMSVTNWMNEGVYFKDGKLILDDRGFGGLIEDNPKYGVIQRSNQMFNNNAFGMELNSPNGVSLRTSNYDGVINTGSGLDGTKNGAVISVDKDGSAVVNGAGTTFLTGGPKFSQSKYSIGTRPHIWIGTFNARLGDRIEIDANYIHLPTTYYRTTGSAPNLCIASDGALVRSTSASKYKTDIKRSYSTEYGEKLLNLPTAIWTDKGQKERYKAGKRHIKPEKYFGMIAEDLADAGLDLLVSRNPQTHEIEGIQYERIAPALLPVIKELKDKVDKLEKKVNE